MIYFFLTYLFLSLAVSYLLSLFTSRRFLKILIFSLSLSLSITFWFRNPGESFIAPIISIMLLESTILEGNGIYRVLRPLAITFLFSLIFSVIFWKKKPKS